MLRERSINWLPLTHTPTRDQTHYLGMCTYWESNQRHFISQSDTQPTEPHRSGPRSCLLSLLPQIPGSVSAQFSTEAACCQGNFWDLAEESDTSSPTSCSVPVISKKPVWTDCMDHSPHLVSGPWRIQRLMETVAAVTIAQGATLAASKCQAASQERTVQTQRALRNKSLCTINKGQIGKGALYCPHFSEGKELCPLRDQEGSCQRKHKKALWSGGTRHSAYGLVFQTWDSIQELRAIFKGKL